MQIIFKSMKRETEPFWYHQLTTRLIVCPDLSPVCDTPRLIRIRSYPASPAVILMVVFTRELSKLTTIHMGCKINVEEF